MFSSSGVARPQILFGVCNTSTGGISHDTSCFSLEVTPYVPRHSQGDVAGIEHEDIGSFKQGGRNVSFADEDDCQVTLRRESWRAGDHIAGWRSHSGLAM